MRTMIVSFCALAAMISPAMAQGQIKPAVGSSEVYWTLTVSVPAGNMEKFKQVVAGLVAASKQEPGTLEYEYAATADNSTVDIVERYVDSAAVVHHVVDNFGAHFAKEFLALVKPVRFAVYGTPDEKAKQALAALNPIYLTPFDGFTRE